MTEQFLSSAEVASRLGVSAKALRLYEQRGLIAPVRSNAGWRTYGPAEIARLHQIIALKSLGLSLARIADLMAGGANRLDSVLALQERVLAKENARLARALSLVRAARQKLAQGVVISIDDLAILFVETAGLMPWIEKHFSQSELDGILKREDLDQQEQISAWHKLFDELKNLESKNDPKSPQALDLGRRWLAQSRIFTRGDEKLGNQLRALIADAMADPEAVADLPITRDMCVFLAEIIKQVNDETDG